MPAAPTPQRLRELARFFAWLGIVGFGGPAAHIALMQREVVDRRGWLSQAEFLDLLGATNLIPGPNSTEMAIHIGHRRAGVLGSIVAGLCFILPAALITVAVTWLYLRAGRWPSLQPILTGMQASVVSVVALAVWTLGRGALRTPGLLLAAALATALSLLGVADLLTIFGIGFVYLIGALVTQHRPPADAATTPPRALLPLSVGTSATVAATASATASVAMSVGTAAAAGTAWTVPTVPLAHIALFFLRIGSVIYGSGYVLVALLLRGLVQENGWLPHAVLLDAVAIGQITPGPVFTTATSVGYLLHGPAGAAAATGAIFAPSFLFVWLLVALFDRLRGSRRLRLFLDGVNAASLGLMAAAVGSLGALTRTQPGWLLWIAATLLCAIRFRLNPSWLIVAGAAAGATQLLLPSP